MYEIKNIDKKSLAKIIGLVYGLVGFVVSISVAVSTMTNVVLKKDFEGSVTMVALFNVGAGLLLGVVTALVSAMIGWLVGYVIGSIYNWFSKKVGGIKIELSKAEEETPKSNQD